MSRFASACLNTFLSIFASQAPAENRCANFKGYSLVFPGLYVTHKSLKDLEVLKQPLLLIIFVISKYDQIILYDYTYYATWQYISFVYWLIDIGIR